MLGEMSKEQFKISLVELLNYYIENIIGYNLKAKDVGDNEGVINMIQTQANALTMSFEQSLDKLIEETFDEDTIFGEDEE